ncbi:MAG: hypothetical protein HOV68_32045 [Streptomycetaceae bacterium]|nr:hypothetical protein [Streptomycetaceae bacterium]
MMATPSTAAHRTGTEIAEEFDRYRHVVAEIFDCHHRQPGPAEAPATCTCGAAWPCAQEMLAAELLDWI